MGHISLDAGALRHFNKQGLDISRGAKVTGAQVSAGTVAVTYTDPRGGTRAIRHAALAGVELAWHRPGRGKLTLSSDRGAYEYGTSQGMPGIVPQPLPEG